MSTHSNQVGVRETDTMRYGTKDGGPSLHPASGARGDKSRKDKKVKVAGGSKDKKSKKWQEAGGLGSAGREDHKKAGATSGLRKDNAVNHHARRMP
jgi:hypothetical protein